MPFNAGFSFIELTIVILLMGLAGAMASPLLTNSWNNQQLRHYSLLTLAELHYARQLAITSERDVLVHLEQHRLCTGFTDESPDNCQPSAFKLEQGFLFQHSFGYGGAIHFTAGRGFAAFSAGQLAISKNGHDQVSALIISSLGRIRWCHWGGGLHGVAHCGS